MTSGSDIIGVWKDCRLHIHNRALRGLARGRLLLPDIAGKQDWGLPPVPSSVGGVRARTDKSLEAPRRCLICHCELNEPETKRLQVHSCT
jgi:hypothetical protein